MKIRIGVIVVQIFLSASVFAENKAATQTCLFKLFLAENKCQIAIWITDENEQHNYSWYRGQPSVVWRGSILVGDASHESKAQIIGHGHVSGENGQIDPDLTTLTTSLELIKNITATYHP
jgi:hypothetical protein